MLLGSRMIAVDERICDVLIALNPRDSDLQARKQLTNDGSD